VELLGAEEVDYTATYFAPHDDIDVWPLSDPPKNESQRKDAHAALTKMVYELQSKLVAPETTVEMLELQLRNGGFLPTHEELEELLQRVAHTLSIANGKPQQRLTDFLPAFQEHLRKRVEAGGLARRTAADWPKFVQQFVEKVGDLPLQDIEPKDAYTFAKIMADDGLTNSTIKSRVTSLARMLHLAETEGLIKTNPFNALKLSAFGQKKENYRPLNDAQLTALFGIPNLPPEVRYLWTILITTGMRMEEAALLHTRQVVLDDDPYFDLRGAAVKNKGSERRVPIPSLIHPLAARLKATPMATDGRLLSFAQKSSGKSRASEVSNYWRKKVDLTKLAPEGRGRFTIHSMRGTVKDKLRDAEVSDGLNDAILGHGQHTVAASYGEGHSLRRMKEALDRLEHPYLTAAVLS
jgi:integrase